MLGGNIFLAITSLNFEFSKFKMADGFAPKRYERGCHNLLLLARSYRLDHRDDELVLSLYNSSRVAPDVHVHKVATTNNLK